MVFTVVPVYCVLPDFSRNMTLPSEHFVVFLKSAKPASQIMRTIAYITDLHLDESFAKQHGVDAAKNWKLVLDDVRGRGIDEVICGGDIGELTAYSKFFDSLKDFKLHVTPGNHDRSVEVLKYHTSPELTGKRAVFGSHDDEHFKYVFLDTSKESLDEEQFRFLLNELKTDKKVLLFMHHPVLAVSTPVDRLYPLYGREKIAEQLQRHKKEVLVFCGHYHVSDERVAGNITQFVTPAVSFQIVKEAESLQIHNNYFGYRIITLDEDSVTTDILIYKNGSFNTVEN
jgi:3',5'-cyclic-AMP phosphodiesterase